VDPLDVGHVGERARGGVDRPYRQDAGVALPTRVDRVADIELIRAEQINAAYERMLEGDVKYRFVIDAASLSP
jgi:hypothetical protein